MVRKRQCLKRLFASFLMRPPPETGDRWAKQSRHTSQMDRLHKRGEELAVAAPARPSGRDGVMASPPLPRRRWLLEGAGAAFQHVLTASTVTYDEAEHCPKGHTRLRCKVIAYMKNRVSFPLINSH